MTESLDTLALRFLDQLEAEEVKLLTWGVVDGGFSQEEIELRAVQFLEQQETDSSPASLIDAMLRRRLLFEFNLEGRRLLRTRMAESVRLFARLRQLFPWRRWQVSPTLVADYRFSLRQRAYPSRRIPPEEVIHELEREGLLNGVKKDILGSMLQQPGEAPRQLARFQLHATNTLLRDIESRQNRGMIIGAPTGTGKTLAFYLPALTHVASLIKSGSSWAKALAIYPRNELLKDQFSEVYSEARRLDATLKEQAGRKLTIGAYFSPTPREASERDLKTRKWEPSEGGYICPYLLCPRCKSSLIWRESDLKWGVEELYCTNRACGTVIGSDEIVLTRDRMAATPPDILFTTTETLNRRISDSRYGRIFGVGAHRPPQLVLLDEVHTYSGTHGAQVAYLLRRWRHAVGARVHFTGLSATLRNAGEFFGLLVGLPPTSIDEITQTDDLEPKGVEYQLALRGDPVSGASLLSTSIQTAMLLRRILDPTDRAVSEGAYGSRAFVFTDDLDVTNRLYHSLLDAEGFVIRRGHVTHRRAPLDDLRSHSAAEAVRRLLEGQSWYMCEQIGHRLSRPINIGRTSSQDIGVEQTAEVIVTTPSLEVGFNDPSVGAVMQHKAPRDTASFLQRKGRAGRVPTMRPWMVVVLSDYGRDRVAYQGYDLLFDPALDERSLPVGNRYVLRMQAVFAYMDWVSLQLREGSPAGSVWSDFSGPPTFTGVWADRIRQRQQREAELTRELIENPNVRRSFETYLTSALSISENEVQALLWEPPRPLMTAVLPTLLRRLESDWTRIKIRDSESKEDLVENAPLPDFIPENLFSDLNLPEVSIVTPPQLPNAEPRVDLMPITQAIKEFAPGRVSRRFGIHHLHASHWIAPPDINSPEQTLAVESYCAEYEEAGIFQLSRNGEVLDIRCIRPWELRPIQSPPDVLTTSNAFPDWCSQLIPVNEGEPLDLPQGSPWCEIITEVRFFTHNRRSNVEVRRFAIGSRANLRLNKGRELETYVRFVHEGDGTAAGVGFAQGVDGVVFRFSRPRDFNVRPDDPNRAKVRAFRAAFFKHRVQTDERLGGLANFFQRGWLYQIYLSTLTARALADQISLREANERLLAGNVGEEMARVLEIIFQTLNIDESPELDEENAETPATTIRQPTHERLLTLCQDTTVTDALGDLARVLWEEPDEAWHRWAALRFKATLGGALLEACFQLCPLAESGDLILDINPGPRPGDSQPIPDGVEEIWITESTLGGGGLIEEILRRYSSDPLKFFRLAQSALEPSDFEIVDAELTRLLELEAADTELADAMAGVRRATSYESLRRATEGLRRVLSSRGILVSHPVMAAVNARILRPGSSAQTDELLRLLIRRWRAEEERVGVEIDARVFAYVASGDDQLDQALAHLGAIYPSDPNWRFQVIYGLLWPRGNLIRSQALSSYNPFAPLPEADRELLLDVLRPAESKVSLNDANWRTRVAEALAQSGAVSLVAQSVERERLKRAILDLVAEPLEVGFLHLYPQIEGVQREDHSLSVRLSLREVVQ